MKRQVLSFFVVMAILVSSLIAKSGNSNVTRLTQAGQRTVHLRIVKKIFDQKKPWLPAKVSIEYGNGFYLGKGRILTDIETTRYGESFEARFYNDASVYKVQLKHQGYDTGLALLSFVVPEKKKKKPVKNEQKIQGKTKKTNEESKKSNAKNKKRILDLKLLKKSDTDIPFIEVDNRIHIEQEKNNNKINRNRTLDLSPLAFSMLSSLKGSDLFITTLSSRREIRKLNIKFDTEKFQALENSIIDYHWLYSVSRKSQDFLMEFRGSPVLYKDRIIGIFHPVNRNKGYVIPAGVIRSFLDDINDGRYDGLKHSGLLYRQIINPARRKYLGLKENEGGLEITNMALGNPVAKKIHKGDIILSVDQLPVGKYGFIYINKQRWNIEEYLRSRMRIKKKVQVLVLRGNSRLIFDLLIKENQKEHPGRKSFDAPSPWFLSSGLVFENLSYENAHLLKSKKRSDVYLHYLNAVQNGFLEKRYSLLLTNRFPIRENLGTQKFVNSIVQSINGRRVYNLVELANEWKRTRTKYVVLEFYDRKDKLILPYSKFSKVDQRVENLYKLQENARVR